MGVLLVQAQLQPTANLDNKSGTGSGHSGLEGQALCTNNAHTHVGLWGVQSRRTVGSNQLHLL